MLDINKGPLLGKGYLKIYLVVLNSLCEQYKDVTQLGTNRE